MNFTTQGCDKSKVTMSRIDKVSSDKSTFVFLKIENSHKMVIYERELRIYSKTNSIVKVFAVKRESEPKPKWELEFNIKGETERALLVTTRNKPRQFSKLNHMVELVKDWCPNLDSLILDLKQLEK